MKIDFISSGDSASYKVHDWGKSWHGARLEICWRALPLHNPDGSRRFNYTSEEYEEHVANVGYMTWHRPGQIPWEIIHSFNVERVEEHARFLRQFSELRDDPQYIVRLCRGRYRFFLNDSDDFDAGVHCVREELPDE
jgi:hypothetical protein